MLSGTWFPPPVRAAVIPKAGGGTRTLGVPTIAGRVAQTVAANRIGAVAEKFFHADSYGCRPGRGAHDALAVARKRCWDHDWVLEFDIRKFFDSVPHDLVVRAVEGLRLPAWVLLYVKRWLTAPAVMPDGEVRARDRGTPQGSAVSPCWPTCSCTGRSTRGRAGSSRTARSSATPTTAWSTVRARCWPRWSSGCGTSAWNCTPDKTQIVYCKDSRRRRPWDVLVSFDFLGYAFRPCDSKGKNGKFTGSGLAASPKAARRMSEIVAGWLLHRLTALTWEQLAGWIGPVIRGWMAYYGRFRHSELHPLLARINWHVQEWIRAKYRRLRPYKAMKRAWNRITAQSPGLLPYWHLETGPGTSQPNGESKKSPVTRECHTGICGSPGVKFPGPPDHPSAQVNCRGWWRRGRGWGRKAKHFKPVHTGGTACITTRRELAKNKTSHPSHQWPQE
jgi:RNA-directed DNA polymerase